ncbi:MAG: hypothetical protein HN704_07060 [Bacteroidetes bacterium]|jgi:hypothetical protein|nr:hypothetical protein [Bacteroidota bacterium]MBT6686503.1 hypothetical protein [Bacteroidota bacterium]MBT7144238.1 hypothetical protein [Bacteroidota bacterium]MBT7491346.1 hypothetical protein [Bacteroidota bacterium]
MRKLFQIFSGSSLLKWKIFFLLIISLISCDLDKLFPPCEAEEPKDAQLFVYITINEENKNVPITIFEGNIEDSLIVWEDFSKDKEFWVYLPLNKYYTAAAEYQVGNKTIIAIDGEEMKSKEKYDENGDPCWEIYGGYLYCELDYEK